MRVLVTGAAGFIGSNLVNWYAKHGYKVTGIDDYSVIPQFKIDSRVKMLRIDICDEKALLDAMVETKPELINHHAARIDPRDSMDNPVADTMTNYIGTINVVNAAITTGCEKIIFASSCAVYGDIGASSVMVEGQFELPNCPYGVSKLAAEKFLRLTTQNSDCQAVVLRYPNVYGPSQNGTRSTGVIAIFAYAMANNRQITIYGDGTARYQYCFIDDIVKANVAAERYMKDSEHRFMLANLAAPSVSVNDIATMLAQHFPDYDQCPRYGQPRLGEQYSITMSGEAAKKVLDWTPKISITEGIARVAARAKQRYSDS